MRSTIKKCTTITQYSLKFIGVFILDLVELDDSNVASFGRQRIGGMEYSAKKGHDGNTEQGFHLNNHHDYPLKKILLLLLTGKLHRLIWGRDETEPLSIDLDLHTDRIIANIRMVYIYVPRNKQKSQFHTFH